MKRSTRSSRGQLTPADDALTFRSAVSADIPLLQSLAEEIWRASYTEMISAAQVDYMLGRMYAEEAIRGEIDAGGLWEIAELDGEPIGYLACKIEPEAAEMKIDKLYLRRALQGCGLGQRMLAHIVDLAGERRISRLWLQVNKNNPRAIRAYERAGFCIERADVFDIGGGFVMDDFIMAKALDP